MARKLSLEERAKAARDPLSYERSVLANDRTLLAYVRTALAMLGAGIAFSEFGHSPVVTAIGWVLLPAGCFVLWFGFVSHRRSQRRIDANGRQEERDTEREMTPGPENPERKDR